MKKFVLLLFSMSQALSYLFYQSPQIIPYAYFKTDAPLDPPTFTKVQTTKAPIYSPLYSPIYPSISQQTQSRMGALLQAQQQQQQQQQYLRQGRYQTYSQPYLPFSYQSFSQQYPSFQSLSTQQTTNNKENKTQTNNSVSSGTKIASNAALSGTEITTSININLQIIQTYEDFNSIGFSLESSNEKGLKKIYNVATTDIQISFNYSLSINDRLNGSFVVVSWDGIEFNRSSNQWNSQIVTLNLVTKIGVHYLAFKVYRSSRDKPFVVNINSVLVSGKQCFADYGGKDYINNGGFQIQTCNYESPCYSTLSNKKVPNWKSNNAIKLSLPEIEIDLLADGWAADLDTYSINGENSCIGQSIPSIIGKYRLKWQYAPHSLLQSSSYELKINGQSRKFFEADKYKLFSQTFQFNVISTNTNQYFQFCGKGTSDDIGAFIDNVEMFSWNPCLEMREIFY